MCTHACCAPCRELSLKGNQLQSQGAVDLFSSLLTVCEKGERLPSLVKVFLVDNAIDMHGPTGVSGPITCARRIRQYVCMCGTAMEWTALTMYSHADALDTLTTKTLCTVHCSYRLLTKDPLVQEINLGANLIGESAALEILEGLKQRKEGILEPYAYVGG